MPRPEICERAGTAHWHALLRARAIENQVFVIAAAQTGYHNERRESFGCALIVSPWGEVLAEIAPECTGIATAEVSMQAVQETQAKMPVQQHKAAAAAAVASPILHHSMRAPDAEHEDPCCAQHEGP